MKEINEMEIEEKLKIANTALSKELTDETLKNERMFYELEELQRKVESLQRAYQNKMQVSRIVVEHDNMNFVLQVLKSQQTPEGLFITGRI